MSGEIIPITGGKGAVVSRNWVTTHFLAFYSQPQNSHEPGGSVI